MHAVLQMYDCNLFVSMIPLHLWCNILTILWSIYAACVDYMSSLIYAMLQMYDCIFWCHRMIPFQLWCDILTILWSIHVYID